MASTLTRVTDFVPATPILSNEVDQEFNQLVNFLNGTSNNIKATLEVSDAGDPPLELNQLSTGPVLKGFQAGVEVFRFRNDGALRTPAIRDANDNEQLIFVPTASAVNEFSIKNAITTAQPELQATGGDADISMRLVPKGTGVVKIQAGDPVADEDAANKNYVDDRRTRWSAGFTIADVAARGVDADFTNIQGIPIPGANFVCTHLIAKWSAGSASGSFTLTFAKQAAGSAAQTVLGTITFNSGSIGVAVINDIGDHAFAENDFVNVVITAASSPLQKSVWCAFKGYQTPQNP